jgi:hypothetical protein
MCIDGDWPTSFALRILAGICLGACSAMWVLCAVLLAIASTVFVGDIDALRARMKSVAQELRLARAASPGS